jgi:hypothetical protein
MSLSSDYANEEDIRLLAENFGAVGQGKVVR